MIYEQNVEYILKYNSWAQEQGHNSRLGVNAYTDRETGKMKNNENDITMVEKLNNMWNHEIEILTDNDNRRRSKRAAAAVPATFGIIFSWIFFI